MEERTVAKRKLKKRSKSNKAPKDDFDDVSGEPNNEMLDVESKEIS
jgi:hypothetical protein